ncbi:MAG: preprotein translocase subunit SecY [Pedosphaera sp.]|nr:preprotein translocase subunit SecY [Pedosphaera sp.]
MLKTFITTLQNCFRIPELRERIYFTLLLLAVCRLIALIPIPGLDGQALVQFLEESRGKQGEGGMGLLGMYSMFTGGALESCAIGSLGIMPYISATIILQLMTAVVPSLAKMVREEGGRAQIIKYGRYMTVLLCLGQGFVMSLGWEKPEQMFGSGAPNLVQDPGLVYRITTMLVLTCGTVLLMWLGEQITERGIGNGISLVISIGIVARFPQAIQSLFEMFFPNLSMSGLFSAEALSVSRAASKFHIFHGIALVLLLLAVIAGVIAVTQAQRKIPVQYAQRVKGSKVFQGGSSFMPLKVNYAGVMPIIFAQAILMFPQKIFEVLGKSLELDFLIRVGDLLQYGQPMYLVTEGLMILFFSYFWVATQFNETQIADDLKKYGGYIPGVRPGSHTSDFLHHTMSRITLAGALFLVAIAIMPALLMKAGGINFAVAQFFGGTSMLITVGVMLDTMKQMESHLMMRHYDGFLAKGKIRGRRG